MIKWMKPQESVQKLNIDDCSKSNPSNVGGGGVLRDPNGNLILAFLTSLDVTTSI